MHFIPTVFAILKHDGFGGKGNHEKYLKKSALGCAGALPALG
jgi:hypothetical protein